MNGETAVPAQNRTAIVAITVAAVALGAFALVGIGVLLGWIPRGAPPDAPPASSGAGAPAKAPSNGLQKFSGSEPLMPKYSQPHAPPPAPAQSFPAETRPAAPQAMPAAAPVPPPPRPSREPAARPLRFRGSLRACAARASAGPSRAAAPAPPAQSRGLCEECGRIMGIANWRSGWEVRVRFDNGSTQTYPSGAARPSSSASACGSTTAS